MTSKKKYTYVPGSLVRVDLSGIIFDQDLNDPEENYTIGFKYYPYNFDFQDDPDNEPVVHHNELLLVLDEENCTDEISEMYYDKFVTLIKVLTPRENTCFIEDFMVREVR